MALRDDETEDSFSNKLCTIARKTGSLKEVGLHGPKVDTNALNVLADTNAELEVVHLSTGLPAGKEKESLYSFVMNEMIESLAKCKALSRLRLLTLPENEGDRITSTLPSFADACVRFRGRNVSIEVDYLRH